MANKTYEVKIKTGLDTDGVKKGGKELDSQLSAMDKRAFASALKQQAAFAQLPKSMQRVFEQSSKVQQRILAGDVKEYQKTSRELSRIAETTAKRSADAYEKHLGASFFKRLAQNGSSAFSSIASGIGGSISSISSIAGGALSVFGGNLITSAISKVGGGIKDLIQTGISFNDQMERAQIGFTTIIGDADKAKKHLDALVDFGTKTPFKTTELVEYSQRLQAMGFNAEQVIPTLKAAGDAAAGLGGGSELIGRITLALGQMKIKGKVSGEEIRQLAEAGIPAWEFLSKAAGKSIADMQKLAEKGALNADRAIFEIIKGMENRFPDLMKNVEGTYSAQLSTLEDLTQQRAGKIFNPLFEEAKKAQGLTIQGLSSGFADSMVTGGADIQKAIFNSFNSSLTALASGDLPSLASSVGQAIPDGILVGIKNRIGAVVGAASDLGTGAIKSLESTIGARSPAREFIKLGEFAGEGFEIGLMNSTQRAFINFDKLTKEQLENARKIIEVGREMGAPDKHIRAAISTGIVESRMRNLNYGDAKSHGVFQQQPFKEWGGTVAGTMDVANAAKMFYEHATKYDRPGYSPGELAARVQRPRKDLEGLYGNAMSAADKLIARVAGAGDALRVHVVGGDMGAPTAADNIYFKNKMLQRPRSRGGADSFVDRYDRETSGGFVDRYDKETGNTAAFDRVNTVLAQLHDKNQILTTDISHLGTVIVPHALSSVQQVAAVTTDAFGDLPPLINKTNDSAKELEKQFKDVSRGVTSILGDAAVSLFTNKPREAFASIRRDFGQMMLGMFKDMVQSRIYKALTGAGMKSGSAGAGEQGGGGLGGLLGGILKLFGKGGKSGSGTAVAGVGDPPITNAITSALTGGGRVGGNLGFGLPNTKTLFDLIKSPEIALASGITAPASLSSPAMSSMDFLRSIGSPLGKTGISGLFKQGGLLSGIGFGSKAGSGGALASILPLLGVGAGAKIGGGGLGSIIGGVGGGLLGIGLTAAPALFGAGGALASPLLAGLFSNPITAAVGGALLVGALIIGKNKARRKDEETRTKILLDSKSQITEIIRQVTANKLDGSAALTQAGVIRSNYLSQVSQLKDKKTRGIAEATVREIDAMIKYDLQPAVDRQLKRQDKTRQLVPEFARGGTVWNQSMLQLIKVKPGERFLPPREHEKLFAQGGIIPGMDKGVDDTYMLAPQGARIQNKQQQFAQGGTVAASPDSSTRSLSDTESRTLVIEEINLYEDGEGRMRAVLKSKDFGTAVIKTVKAAQKNWEL